VRRLGSCVMRWPPSRCQGRDEVPVGRDRVRVPWRCGHLPAEQGQAREKPTRRPSTDIDGDKTRVVASEFSPDHLRCARG
jgi:hypothetical protein